MSEPVAWINRKGKNGEHGYLEWDKDDEAEINTPLYTHSDQMGLAESIIKQQKIEIDALKNYVEAQNKKIIDLAFEKVYAERSLEIANQFNELTDGEITVLATRHLHHIE
jgi:hypothetical protein